jgi:hypothetical protein
MAFGVRTAITTSHWLTAPLNIRRGAAVLFVFFEGAFDEENQEENDEPTEKYGDSADCDLYRNVEMLDSDG